MIDSAELHNLGWSDDLIDATQKTMKSILVEEKVCCYIGSSRTCKNCLEKRGVASQGNLYRTGSESILFGC